MALRPSPSERLGVFRLKGYYVDDGEKSWADVLTSDGATCSREEVHRSKRGPQTVICNGETALSISPGGKRRQVSGMARQETILGRLAVLIGDWREFFESVEVLARTERDERAVYIVRATPKDGLPAYYVIDAENGRALQRIRSIKMPFGSMGKIATFGDYREVEGVAVPFMWEGRYASESRATGSSSTKRSRRTSRRMGRCST